MKEKGRNNTLSEVICICTCGMYLIDGAGL